MIGQKTIHSFFSPVSKKRISKDLSQTEDEAQDAVSDASGSRRGEWRVWFCS